METRFAALHVDGLFLFVTVLFPLRQLEKRYFTEDTTLLVFTIIASLYFLISSKFFAATIGQRVLGYKVIPVDGKKARYTLRMVFGLLASAMWFLTWLANRHVEDGIYWWDRVTNTRAVPLAYHPPN